MLHLCILSIKLHINQMVFEKGAARNGSIMAAVLCGCSPSMSWCEDGPPDIPLGSGKIKYSGGHSGVRNYKSPWLPYHSHPHYVTAHYKSLEGDTGK